MNSTECFFFQPTDYTSSATVCKWCGKEKYQHKSEQKQLIIDIMNDDAKDGLYKKQTAVEWLVEQITNKVGYYSEEVQKEIYQQAKEMEKQQIENAFRIGATTELTFGGNNAEKYYNKEYGGEQ